MILEAGRRDVSLSPNAAWVQNTSGTLLKLILTSKPNFQFKTKHADDVSAISLVQSADHSSIKKQLGQPKETAPLSLICIGEQHVPTETNLNRIGPNPKFAIRSRGI